MSVLATSYQYRWVKKNVAVLKEQPYISSMENYISEISFELNYYQQDETTEKRPGQATWKEVCQNLLIDEDFGFELNLNNLWMDEAFKGLTAGALNAEKMRSGLFSPMCGTISIVLIMKINMSGPP